MKFLLPLFLILTICSSAVKSQQISFPDSIYSGPQSSFHVQGVAVDPLKGFVYFSFTDRLIKTDLSGKMIGSVTGFVGHLGDLDLSPDGKVYGSLEYKNDAIGKGIQTKLGANATDEDGFYVAIFDVAAIVRPNMNAEEENILKTVFIREATDDYKAEVTIDGRREMHRFGCSGIDGIAFAPAIGAKESNKKYLYVAYGIYGDNKRTDNDQQVILQYDISDWSKYGKKLSQRSLHHSGPEKPIKKHFFKTGNTKYGIQNLAYDSQSGYLFAAVYRGAKPEFPNYDLFAIDTRVKPTKGLINGWHFPFGSTGLCPLPDGSFYISHPAKTKEGRQETTLFKYRWVGNREKSFELINSLNLINLQEH